MFPVMSWLYCELDKVWRVEPTALTFVCFHAVEWPHISSTRLICNTTLHLNVNLLQLIIRCAKNNVFFSNDTQMNKDAYLCTAVRFLKLLTLYMYSMTKELKTFIILFLIFLSIVSNYPIYVKYSKHSIIIKYVTI